MEYFVLLLIMLAGISFFEIYDLNKKNFAIAFFVFAVAVIWSGTQGISVLSYIIVFLISYSVIFLLTRFIIKKKK